MTSGGNSFNYFPMNKLTVFSLNVKTALNVVQNLE